MKYKVSIELLEQMPDASYPKTVTIYEQTKEDLDIPAVIKAVNSFT